MKSALLFSFLVFIGLNSFAQSTDTIYWNANRKLTWEDFKGRPDKTTNLLAMTQAGIGYEVACKNGELKLKIYCYFNVTKSWTKETNSEDLLRHEQVHFDITELYTRKLRKRLSELSDPCGKDIKELDKAYTNIFKACADRQDAYDRESEHSLNDEQQKMWEAKIASELKALEKFASKVY
jgi:predicted secreted Zn-dependent protease